MASSFPESGACTPNWMKNKKNVKNQTITYTRNPSPKTENMNNWITCRNHQMTFTMTYYLFQNSSTIMVDPLSSLKSLSSQFNKVSIFARQQIVSSWTKPKTWNQAKFLIETQSQLDKDLGNIPVVTIKGAWIWFVCLANESSSIALIIFRRSFWSKISMSLILTMSLLDFIKCGVGGGNQKALPITKMVVTIKSNGNVVFILVLLSSMVRREMSMILYSWVTFVPRERWLLS